MWRHPAAQAGDSREASAGLLRRRQGSQAGRARTCFVVIGIVVQLPFLARPVGLPVMARLWRPKQEQSKVDLAASMLRLLAACHHGRRSSVLIALWWRRSRRFAPRDRGPPWQRDQRRAGRLPGARRLPARGRRAARQSCPAAEARCPPCRRRLASRSGGWPGRCYQRCRSLRSFSYQARRRSAVSDGFSPSATTWSVMS